MSESTVNTYATNNSNQAAGSPNTPVVISDGTGQRQVVVLGAGDGTTTLVDGTPANPQNSKITDGTNTASVVAGDSGFNGLATASGTKTYPFTTSATGVQQLLANTPMSGYSKVTLIYTSVGGGLAATVQFSPNSGGTYMNVPSFVSRASSNATAGNSGVTNSIFYESPVIGEFLQLNITAMTSGTTSGYIILSNTPWTYPGTIGVGTYSVQSNSATGSGAPANAFMMGVNDGTNLQYVTNLSNTGDASSNTHSLPVGVQTYNGTNYDRQRGANAASNTTGTGLLGVGNLAYDGTNWQTLGAVAGDTGFNGLAIGSGVKTYSFTTIATGAQTLLANTPCEGFAWVEIVFTSVGGSLALTAPFSTTSGGTYINSNTWGSGISSTTGTVGTSTGLTYYGPVKGNFFQLAISAMVSGTTSGTVTFRAIAPPAPASNVSQQGTWTVGYINNAVSTGTITTSSSAITSGNYINTISGYVPVTIHGTYSGVSFGITVSDDSGTTFYNAPIYDSNNSRWLVPGTTITPGTNASSLYWVPLPVSNTGSMVKVLASAYSSGTATVRIEGTAGTGLPGSSMSQIMDAAGNARGANVDVNGNLNTKDSGSSPVGTALNTYSIHLTSNATTTPTASTAYISSITISNEVGGTTSTITIQDKQGTPLKLVNGVATTALTTAPTVINFQTPVKMVSGIDVITAGAVAATVDVWVNYYQ